MDFRWAHSIIKPMHMNQIIGQLYDRDQALQIQLGLREQGIEAELYPVVHEGQNIFELAARDENQVSMAREYFRIRMGLPGARQAPDPQWQKIHALKMGVFTKFLLGFSILLYIVRVADRGAFENLARIFFFNDPNGEFFESIASGEVWRLITPIFLHFSFLHILFNGMWIKDLGAVYENEKGTRSFVIFVLFVSALSNIMQYLAMGPTFGGLSGLVYGLLGYLWVYGSLHEEASIKLPKRDVVIIVGWYFLCLTGLIGPIANVAHGVGLGVGMIWGFFPLSNSRDKTREKSRVIQYLKYFVMALFFGLGTYLIELSKIYFQFG